MEYLLLFIISFLIVYLVYFIIVVNRKKGIEAFKEGKQVAFFKNAYKLNLKKLDYKKFANSLSLVNAFIISTTLVIVEFVPGLIFKLLVALAVLIPLILICYTALGKVYKKKEGK